MNERHIMIDWSMVHDEDYLIDVIQKSGLFVDEVKTLSYSDSNIASRFYGQNVNDERFKSPFNLYVITDTNPIYEDRSTTRGTRSVNVNIFDLKQKVRRFTKGQIHATDNPKETEENLDCLGIELKKMKHFKSLSHLFEEMNNSGINYLVMRNFEEFPDNAHVDEHLDIDVLTDDYYAMKEVVGGVPVCRSNRIEDGGYRILNWVNVGDTRIMMDIRHVGDDYYCKSFQKDMLSNKVFDETRRIWIPEKDDHLHALIYHALVHKNHISKTYLRIFEENNVGDDLKSVLDSWMKKKSYAYVKPKDASVGFLFSGRRS